MKVIRVQYTVKDEFVETNKKNISTVMTDLKATGNTDVKYTAFQHEDSKTFMHIVMYKTEVVESLPASLESFKEFQKQLKENIEIPPKAEVFNVVDSSYELF